MQNSQQRETIQKSLRVFFNCVPLKNRDYYFRKDFAPAERDRQENRRPILNMYIFITHVRTVRHLTIYVRKSSIF